MISETLKIEDYTELTNFLNSKRTLEVSNPLSKKRIKVQTDDIIKFLLNYESNNVTEDEYLSLSRYRILKDINNMKEDEEDIQMWEKNNWSHSLIYYLWSRGVNFIDSGSEYNEIRESVLDHYKKEGAPPQKVDKRCYSGEVALEDINNNNNLTLGEIFLRRTTVQSFKDVEMEYEVFNKIINESFKELRDEHDYLNLERNNLDFLTGLGYPFEIYFAIFNVENIEPGIYKYDTRKNVLMLLKKGDFRLEMQKVLIGQNAPLTSAFAILISVDYEQKQWRYRHEKELQNTYIVAAQLCQRIVLNVTNQNRFCNLTPACIDDLAARLVDLNDKEEQILYTLNIGM